MKMRLSICVALICAASCTSQQDVDAASPVLTLNFQENYQAVYARTNKAIRSCSSRIGFTSFTTDAQLYPALNYAEIRHGIENINGFNPQYEVRFEPSGTGSTVSVKTVNDWTGANARWVQHWAEGGTKCPIVPGGPDAN